MRSSVKRTGVGAAAALLVCFASQAQDTVWTKPAPAGQSTATAAQEATTAGQAATPPTSTTASETPMAAAAKSPSYYVPVAGKKNKLQYVGPKEPVELAATPMLDEEGRQRIDPAGEPMFNPPVRQQRDKHGNPVFDEHGAPVMQAPGSMGFDERGKKIREKKVKVAKSASIFVERGILTVDGMPGKAGLNYEIKNLKYIYLYTPWIGTTIVSAEPFPGAAEQKNAFSDRTLTVAVEEHSLQLYSDKRFFAKPKAAYVAVDRDFKLPLKYPAMGFGNTLQRPYTWPGSRQNAALHGPVAPPPLPVSLRPVAVLESCPPGMMRPPRTTEAETSTAYERCVSTGAASAAKTDSKSSSTVADPARAIGKEQPKSPASLTQPAQASN